LKKLLLFVIHYKIMYLSYMQGPPNNGTVYTGQMPNVPLNTFCSPSPSSFSEIRSKTDHESGSTTSEGSSPVWSAVPSSISGSISENRGQSVRTDPMMGSQWAFDYQMPQVFKQATGPQAYQQVSYSPQHYHNFTTSQVGTAIPGYMNTSPYQLQQAPITRSQIYPLQFPYVAYPVQLEQNLATAQNLTSMEDPMLYSPTSETSSDSQRASPNLFANSVNTTPSMGYSSMPGYGNSYGYVNSAIVSSAPCTPMPCVMQSPVVPPTFHLGTNVLGTSIPDQISCNINPTPEPSQLPNSEETYSPTSDKREINKPSEKEVENVWLDNCSYKEYNQNGGSNLFINWNGAEPGLLRKLQRYKLEIRSVSRCSTGLFNVVFDNHVSARKAFLMQREIRLRMVPPKGSHRNWLRNPSPKFLVKFETKCRLVVKTGKAECHDTVGDLLMSSCQQQKGCIIWADQLKGHRIRVVSCEGNFMFPGGRVVQMKRVPTKSDLQSPLGWVLYRCKNTKESFVTRRSSNRLSDYIYME